MFQEKQYRGKHSRYPKVISSVNEVDKLAVFAIAWGDPQAENLAIDTIKDYYLSASTDKEHTSPFPLQSNLSLSANHLRISMMLANDNVFKEYNKEEYMSGIEIMAAAIDGREINVAYIGGPSLVCKKRNKDLLAYIQQNHLGHEFSATKNYPLPSNLLGVEIKKDVTLKSFRLSKNDQLYFILADSLPIIQTSDDIEKVETKIKMTSERPYWIGQWSP